MLCKLCLTEKPLSEMVRSGSARGCGYKHRCMECRNLIRRLQYAMHPEKTTDKNTAWRTANRDRVLAAHARYRALNPEVVSTLKKVWYAENKQHCNEKSRRWHEANKDEHRARSRAYAQANKEKLADYYREWRASNKARRTEYQATRRAAKASRTPPWVDRTALQEVYAYARHLRVEKGLPVEVDHVIPLRGKTVSGLHVPWNLKIRTIEANRKKAISWDESEARSLFLCFEVELP